MPTREFRILPEALREVDDAFQWYRTKSLSAAEGFLAEVERGFDAITDSPLVWPAVRGRQGVRRYVLGGYPYDLIYLVLEEVVRVVAVAHHKRKEGYWAGR